MREQNYKGLGAMQHAKTVIGEVQAAVAALQKLLIVPRALEECLS